MSYLLHLSKSACFCLLTVFAIGCGEPGPATVVSGKVTTGGEPVSGTIHFVGADGTEAMAPVGPTGGLYTVANPPVGEVTVLIKGGLGGSPPALKPPTGEGSKMTGMPEMPKMGVAPPAKYADKANGIKYTVTAGKQQKDFDLAP